MERKRDYKIWIIVGLLVVIAVLASWLLTILTPFSPSPQVDSTENTMDMNMTLKTFDVPKGSAIPTLSFTLTKESDANEWDVHITTTNFTFTPDKIGQMPKLGEGHVHLFVDGKLYVVLGSWFHIDTLPKGKHTILLRLANNDHSTYAVNGNYIQASQTVTVQ